MVIISSKIKRKHNSKWEAVLKIEAEDNKYIDIKGKEVKSIYDAVDIPFSICLDLVPILKQISKQLNK